VVGVFHGELFLIPRDAHVMVRAEDQARAFARQELAQRFNFFGKRFLLSDHVIQAKDHQRISVSEYAFIYRQSLPGLVDALVDSNRMSRLFADGGLEAHKRQVKELQSAGDALQEHLL
jgi:hypothetical protein